MPTEICYVIGDAAHPELAPNRSEQLQDGARCDFIAHIVNDVGAWGAGFTRSLDARFGDQAAKSYRAARAAHSRWWPDTLGHVDVWATGDEKTYVAHMFAQHGLMSRANPQPFSLSDFRRCLERLATLARCLGARVHMPRVGTGFGGGRWVEIEPRIQVLAAAVPVYIYDLPA